MDKRVLNKQGGQVDLLVPLRKDWYRRQSIVP